MKFIKLIRFSVSIVAIIFAGIVIIDNIGADGWHTLQKSAGVMFKTVFQTIPANAYPEKYIATGPQKYSLTAIPADRGAVSLSELNITKESPNKDMQGEKLKYARIKGCLGDGGTLAISLSRKDVPAKVRSQIIKNLRSKLDLRHLKPTDKYTIVLDQKGILQSCVYNAGPLESYTISQYADGYKTEKNPIKIERQMVLINGRITSSLFASFVQQHEDPRLIYAFADIFSSRIDFNTETHVGDTYSLVFDKYYKDGKFIGYSKIKAASYQGRDLSLTAYYYTTNRHIGAYFDKNGQELGALLIRSPLPMGRLTSKFSYHRRHPITGRIQPHLGIDLAAPTGTPIMASGDGRIIALGFNGGNGNQIIIAHNAGYKTYYGHMSRYKKGLHRGSLVHKKEIIGYVGQTGIATGPHLDYRISHNGVFENPFGISFKPKSVLSAQEIINFKNKASRLAKLIDHDDGANDQKVIQVSIVTISSDADNIRLL